MSVFDVVGSSLLKERGLRFGGLTYEFAEIELYWHSPEHPDPYVHSHPDQEQYGKWYFHRASHTGTSYRGGTFKGLDLTLGSKGAPLGILIRSIYHPLMGMICGPCLVVDHILHETKCASIAELVGPAGLLDVTDPRLTLVPHQSESKEPIYAGPRIGLTPSKAPEWAILPYRLVHRYSLGRGLKAKRSLKLLGS